MKKNIYTYEKNKYIFKYTSKKMIGLRKNKYEKVVHGGGGVGWWPEVAAVGGRRLVVAVGRCMYVCGGEVVYVCVLF